MLVVLSIIRSDGDPDPHRASHPQAPPPRVRAAGWGPAGKSTRLLHRGLPRAIRIRYQEARIRHHLWHLVLKTHTHTHKHLHEQTIAHVPHTYVGV